MPRNQWLAVTIEIPSADFAGRFAEGIFAFGAQAVQERGATLVTWLELADEAPETLISRLAQTLEQACDGVPARIAWDWLPERDWTVEWKRGLAPRRVGRRLIVTPSWTQPTVAADDVVITIDPQMAFGTGEHASTRGALRLLEQALIPDAHVLDLGTGSAVLAIAAAKLGAASVLAIEADADSVVNARDNLAANGVTDRVRLEHRLADAQYLQALGRFDLILANILSGVIVPLLPPLMRALTPAGGLIIAGILQEEVSRVGTAAVRAGFNLAREDREDQWWAALLRPADPATGAGS